MVARCAYGRCQGVALAIEGPDTQLRIADTWHQCTSRSTRTYSTARILAVAIRRRMAAPEGTHCLRHDDRRRLATRLHTPSIEIRRPHTLSLQSRISEDWQRILYLPTLRRTRTGDGNTVWRHTISSLQRRHNAINTYQSRTEKFLARILSGRTRCYRRNVCQQRGQHSGQLAYARQL